MWHMDTLVGVQLLRDLRLEYHCVHHRLVPDILDQLDTVCTVPPGFGVTCQNMNSELSTVYKLKN